MKYSRIELVIATAFFIIALIVMYNSGALTYYHANNTRFWIGYFVIPRVLMAVTTYGAFLALNYYALPKYLLKKKYVEGVGLTLVIYAITTACFTVFFSYIRDWEYDQKDLYMANLSFFSHGMITVTAFLFFYLVYVGIREGIGYQYQMVQQDQNISTRIKREVGLVATTWIAILLPLWGYHNLPAEIIFFLSFCLPYCFIVYFLNLYLLIPRYKNAGTAGGVRYALNLILVTFFAGVLELAFLLQSHTFSFAGYLVIFWLMPTLLTVAISWWVYLANAERYAQLTSLKTALGTSNANLQYLRSQINPHFLFNVLNTLYGTALSEQAEKTGEGIQKLGDMMRFMLHENNQDKISLGREIEYLHNYIDLQTMRLALSPDITIDIQIEEIVGYDEIAPMLLIPFIENAYKHGISLQEKSWINVSLYKRDGMLHLDVHNSIHTANANDPERYHSGTGLDNVRQRLQLLYPQTHQLVVRQNTREFFVHLSLTLNSQKPN